jgi:hypothetical protein
LIYDVASLHDCRNRVAHAEPFLKKAKIRKTVNQIYAVSKAIDPELKQAIASIQRVNLLTKNYPLVID